MLQLWQRKVKQLKQETFTLYYACQDSRISWHIKLLTIIVVAYAFNPLDLIPDFIPILGYLDDLVLIPLGIALILKLMPKTIVNDAREKARLAMVNGISKPKSWIAASIIICFWLGCGILIAIAIAHR